MSSHFHVASGLAGYGPDASDSDGFARFDTLGEALQYVHESELPLWIDQAHETAQCLAAGEDYRGAWYEVVRADDLEALRQNLNPARRSAPMYVDDLAAYEAMQQDQLATFPRTVSDSSRLYVWECDESYCNDDEDADEPSNWESLSGSLLAVSDDDVPAHLDVEWIAENAVRAAYVAVHESLQRAEGFTRYGDATPGEVETMQNLGRLLVRSVLANGRIAHDERTRTYIVTNDQTGSVLLRTRAASPLEALSNYSEQEGFARPDRMTRKDCENLGGRTLTEALGYAVSEDGRMASITFTNTTLTAEEV